MVTHEFNFPLKLHFHIRWGERPSLDAQAFKTRAEADVVAKRRVQSDQSYSVEVRLGDCERCKKRATGT